MNKISAEIICDSMSPKGDRITTYVLTYPRFIHSELMTHRVFSRNSASSRAIPFQKMVDSVKTDPFIPIAFQKDHSGMQGTEYFGELETDACRRTWLYAAEGAVQSAIRLHNNNVTKQLCNRILEPFLWHKVLITATEYDGFFELRCPKYWLGNPMDTTLYKSRKEARKSIEDIGFAPPLPFDKCADLDWIKISTSGAEIHIQALAEAMYDAMIESTPKFLKPGEWHMPFGDKFSKESSMNYIDATKLLNETELQEYHLKVATARCARTSYNNFDGKIDYQKDIELHDNLLANKHMSPFEHCAQVPRANVNILGLGNGWTHVDGNHNLWSGNLRGWIQYRQLIDKPL